MHRPVLAFPIQIALFFLLFAFAFFGSIAFGAADISLREVWLALTSSETNAKINIMR